MARSGTPRAGGRTRARRRRVEVASRELVEGPGVPDLVLGNRREGDVLLEEGRDAGPFGVSPAEDELVVSDLQEPLCRSLTCLLQLRLQRIAVDAVVALLELVREVADLAEGCARHEPEGLRLLAPPVLLPRVRLGERVVGSGDRARMLERLALPLLPEDLVDHAASARTACRTQASWSRKRRRKSSRSWLFGPCPVTTSSSSPQSGSEQRQTSESSLSKGGIRDGEAELPDPRHDPSRTAGGLPRWPGSSTRHSTIGSASAAIVFPWNCMSGADHRLDRLLDETPLLAGAVDKRQDDVAARQDVEGLLRADLLHDPGVRGEEHLRSAFGEMIAAASTSQAIMPMSPQVFDG